MFDENELSVLDPKYFSIIFTDAFDVTIMSRNTGTSGLFIIRSIRHRGHVSFSISIRHHIHITNTVVRIA